MTTSVFSKEALEYAAGLESKIILIDGQRLTAADIFGEIDLKAS